MTALGLVLVLAGPALFAVGVQGSFFNPGPSQWSASHPHPGGAAVLTAALLPTRRFVVGLVAGFFLTAAVAIVGFGFLLNGDGAFLIAGALGESHTEEGLVAARKAGSIWGAVPNFEVSRRDVDHIVLTPPGVLAVESKWRFRGADRRYLGWAAAKALAVARAVQSKIVAFAASHRAA